MRVTVTCDAVDSFTKERLYASQAVDELLIELGPTQGAVLQCAYIDAKAKLDKELAKRAKAGPVGRLP